MHSTVVVFPAPLAPTRPTISPARTSRSRPATTVLVPYVLRSPRTVTTPRSLVCLIVFSRDWPELCLQVLVVRQRRSRAGTGGRCAARASAGGARLVRRRPAGCLRAGSGLPRRQAPRGEQRGMPD